MSTDFRAGDLALAAQGVPLCPHCGERDRVLRQLGNWWCDRCMGWLRALRPREGRHAPDF